MPPTRWLFYGVNLMADIITVQELKDASLDAHTLETFVNGEPNKQAQSRLGRLIYTLATINHRVDIATNQANQKLTDLDNAINTAAAAGAGEKGWTDQLIALPNGRTQREKNAEFVSIADYGAKSFVGSPTTAFNCHSAVKAASEALADGGTLHIPVGNWAVSGGKIYIKNKNINIVCDGTLYFDTSTPSCGLSFYQDEIVVSGSALNTAIKRGDLRLDTTMAAMGLTGLASDYFVNIRSTEPISLAVLTGGEQYYYKNQTLDFIKSDFSTRLPLLYDYANKANITLYFYKKRRAVDVSLNIMLYNTTATTNVTNVIQTMGAYNIHFRKYSPTIYESNVTNIDGTGFAAVASMFLTFDKPGSSIFCKTAGGASYNFLNSMSSFLTFNDATGNTGGGKAMHWYAARHGRMVEFNRCAIILDDHYGHDYFINNTILPGSVSFTGGNITFNNVTGARDNYLLAFRSDAPLSTGRAVFNNCNTEYGYLFVDNGATSFSSTFRNTFKVWDEIVINGGSCRLSDKNAAIFFKTLDDRYILVPTKKLEVNNLTVTVPDGYTNGPFGCFINGEDNATYKLFDKLILNNVNYEIEGTQTIAGNLGNMFMRKVTANVIQLNNCFGINFIGCKANSVYVNNGSFGLPDGAQQSRWATGISQMDNAYVDIRFNNVVFSKLAMLHSLAADYGTVNKRYYISSCEFNSAMTGSSSENAFIRKAINNHVGEYGTDAWLSFDFKNYYNDAARGERYATVSTTLPSIAVGATSAVATATMKHVRLNQNEVVVGSFDKASNGLQIVAWVSASDTISYYVINPAGNPAGVVNLGATTIKFKTV